MNNAKLIATIFLIAFITVVIALFEPKLPKQIIITEGNYIFVEENSNAPVPVKVADTNVASAPITVTNNSNIKSVQNVKPSSVNVNNVPVKASSTSNIKTTPIKTSNTSNIKTTPVKTTKTTVVNKPAAVKTQTVTKTNSVKQQTKTAPKPVSKPAVSQNNKTDEQWRAQQEQKKAAQEKEQKAKAAQQAKEQAKQNNNYTAQRVLTEHEETIVWNKWRSELQNKVMRDTNIGAPKGTGFKFSFTVDKYGNMSNINVWSTNPVYTDLAVRVIKPVLQSYQHQPILKFPAGTKRTITNVTGGFVMSNYTQYSKPSDYSDVEKVKLKY